MPFYLFYIFFAQYFTIRCINVGGDFEKQDIIKFHRLNVIELSEKIFTQIYFIQVPNFSYLKNVSNLSQQMLNYSSIAIFKSNLKWSINEGK